MSAAHFLLTEISTTNKVASEAFQEDNTLNEHESQFSLNICFIAGNIHCAKRTEKTPEVFQAKFKC